MTLDQIKQAIDNGNTVYWSTKAYQVIKTDKTGYMVHCTINDSYTGLTWLDGVTMNGKPEQFFTA